MDEREREVKHTPGNLSYKRLYELLSFLKVSVCQAKSQHAQDATNALKDLRSLVEDVIADVEEERGY